MREAFAACDYEKSRGCGVMIRVIHILYPGFIVKTGLAMDLLLFDFIGLMLAHQFFQKIHKVTSKKMFSFIIS